MDTQITPASAKAEHVVFTGPIVGTVTLEDGTVVDVSQPVVAVEDEWKAAQIAHAIGQHWAAPENVHPSQIDVDPETGQPVIREFVYDDSHYKAAKKAHAAAAKTKKGS